MDEIHRDVVVITPHILTISFFRVTDLPDSLIRFDSGRMPLVAVLLRPYVPARGEVWGNKMSRARRYFDSPPCATAGECSRRMLKKAVQRGSSE
jgi:hypothetical protein